MHGCRVCCHAGMQGAALLASNRAIGGSILTGDCCLLSWSRQSFQVLDYPREVTIIFAAPALSSDAMSTL